MQHMITRLYLKATLGTRPSRIGRMLSRLCKTKYLRHSGVAVALEVSFLMDSLVKLSVIYIAAAWMSLPPMEDFVVGELGLHSQKNPYNLTIMRRMT